MFFAPIFRYKKTPVEQFVNYCPTDANSSAAILVGPASWKIHRLFSLYCRLICSAKSIISLYHSAVHFASYFPWHFSLHFRGWCQTVAAFFIANHSEKDSYDSDRDKIRHSVQFRPLLILELPDQFLSDSHLAEYSSHTQTADAPKASESSPVP